MTTVQSEKDNDSTPLSDSDKPVPVSLSSLQNQSSDTAFGSPIKLGPEADLSLGLKLSGKTGASVPVKKGQMVLVTVEDNGIGISDKGKKQLFQPFKQAQRSAGGTGLGLFSLSKRIGK